MSATRQLAMALIAESKVLMAEAKSPAMVSPRSPDGMCHSTYCGKTFLVSVSASAGAAAPMRSGRA